MDFSHLELRPYHFPDPVSWWPPAPGWWIVGLVFLFILACILWFFFHWQAQAWRRAAQRELGAIQARFHNTHDRQASHCLAGELSQFLRRVCLTRFRQEDGERIRGTIGEDWLQVLENMVDGKVTFLSHQGRDLLQGAYDPQCQTVGAEHIELCRRWLAALPPVPVFPGQKKQIWRTRKIREMNHA